MGRTGMTPNTAYAVRVLAIFPDETFLASTDKLTPHRSWGGCEKCGSQGGCRHWDWRTLGSFGSCVDARAI